MTWMASVDLRGVDYVGIDVVQSVIASNIEKHPSLNFMALDVADESSVDALRNLVRGRRTLILCRHLLFHLPVQDGRAVLRHLHASGASYLTSTTCALTTSTHTPWLTGTGRTLEEALLRARPIKVVSGRARGPVPRALGSRGGGGAGRLRVIASMASWGGD